MFQLNLPRKLTARIQVWASVLLLFLATCLSLAPVVSLKTAENRAAITKMLAEVAPDMEIEIPEQVDVSAVKIVKAIGVGAKIAKLTTRAAQLSKNLGGAEKDVVSDVFSAEIQAVLESKEGKETILIALSFASTVTSSFGAKGLSGTGLLTDVLAMLITLLVLIALLVFTFVLPIALLIATVSALISALVHPFNPEKAAAKITKKLLGFLTVPFALMLIQSVVPNVTVGAGVIGICAVTVLAVLLGVAISRLHAYEPMAFRYLNIVQGTSALGIVGFCVFFFNLMKTNILASFLGGKFADYLANVTKIAASAKKSGVKINNSYLVDLALILVYVCLVLVSVSYLKKCALRLSCAAKANKKGAFPKDTCIVRGVLLAVVYAIPVYIMNAKHFYYDPTSTAAAGDASLLALYGEQRVALNLVLVGVILVLVAEIALIVLKLVFCKGMDKQEIQAVMSGDAEAETDGETDSADDDIDDVVDDADDDVSDDVSEGVSDDVGDGEAAFESKTPPKM